MIFPQDVKGTLVNLGARAEAAFRSSGGRLRLDLEGKAAALVAGIRDQIVTLFDQLYHNSVYANRSTLECCMDAASRGTVFWSGSTRLPQVWSSGCVNIWSVVQQLVGQAVAPTWLDIFVRHFPTDVANFTNHATTAVHAMQDSLVASAEIAAVVAELKIEIRRYTEHRADVATAAHAVLLAIRDRAQSRFVSGLRAILERHLSAAFTPPQGGVGTIRNFFITQGANLQRSLVNDLAMIAEGAANELCVTAKAQATIISEAATSRCAQLRGELMAAATAPSGSAVFAQRVLTSERLKQLHDTLVGATDAGSVNTLVTSWAKI
jgi:hypothetical protein